LAAALAATLFGAQQRQQQPAQCEEVHVHTPHYKDRKVEAAAAGGDTYFSSDYDYLKVISGSSNRKLAKEIADLLGVGLGDCELGRYADGEISINLGEQVRGKDVYVMQSGQRPVNDHLMELLLLVSTVQRASAKRVTAVIPYFPYKHHRRGVPISTGLNSRFLLSAAADFGHCLEVMGVDRIIAVDLERPGSSNESNFFSPGVPVETLLTTNLFAHHIARAAFPPAHGGDILVVSPSSALMKKSVGFATVLARALPNADVRVTTFVHSTARAGPVDISTNELIASGDVRGRDVVLVDELIDTGGTLATLARKLKEMGARDIYVYSSHALFNNDCLELLERAPITRVYVSNTIEHDPAAVAASSKVEVVSIGPQLAKLIYAEHVRSADIFKEEMTFG
ncbi:N-terminal domain of ribose phosphate pyrophosphokinase-domain-containing protein, partial [Tribonema minus]